MRRTVHILVWSVDPREGGMEQAVCRISEQMASYDDIDVCLYVRNAPSEQDIAALAPNCELVNVGLVASTLLWADGSDEAEIDVSLKRSLNFTLFKNEINKRILGDPKSKHVIVSFYVTGMGFVGQQISDQLGIPHVVCVRGSDFSLHFNSHTHSALCRYVYTNAELVVTTNLTQQHAIINRYKRGESVVTIPNSIDARGMPYWEKSGRSYVQVVADSGYSCRKGSHLLIRAIDSLRKEGIKVRLRVVGPTDRTNAPGEAYWKNLREHIQDSDREGFDLGGILPPADVTKFLMSGDLYCSASFSEGSSNAVNRALVLGMPMIVTDTGSHAKLAAKAPHVSICRPGDLQSLIAGILTVIRGFESGEISIHRPVIDEWRSALSSELEKSQWRIVIERACPLGASA